MNSIFDKKKSLFISANAGSGKTYALAQRFLSLVFSGAEIDKILCITYTNKAADEIKEKITQLMIVCSTGNPPPEFLDFFSRDDIANFANNALVNLAKMKISTIHSFFSDLITKNHETFQINKNFKILGDLNLPQQTLQKQIKRLLNYNSKEIIILAQEYSGEAFDILIQKAIENPISEYKLRDLKKDFAYDNFDSNRSFVDYLVHKIANKDLIKLILDDTKSKILSNPKVKLNKMLEAIDTIDLENITRSELEKLLNIFLTKDGDIRKDCYKAVLENNAEAVCKICNAIYLEHSKFLTQNYIEFQANLNAIYKTIKTKMNAIDFNDILLLICDSIKSNAQNPILYDIDRQIDHIMIDEAQDTNEIQWNIFDAIFKVFNDSERDKSVLVVGDEKQSIYGFNGSDVQSFSDFYDKSRSLLPRLNFEKINLEMSYRSDKNIINFVNNFTQIESIKNLSNISNSAHQYLDSKELGGVFVELYDFKNKDKPEQELLDVADEIAIRIKSIIEKNTDKSIMILKKNRGEKWHKIIYKLQEFGFIIKTDGVDDNLKLCLMDILSILKIANRSISQYEITGLLKSPIFKFNDGDLLKIINSGNGFSIIKDEIWKNVNQSNNEIVQVIFKKLGEDFLVFESTIEAVLKIYANKIISLSLNDFYGKQTVNQIFKFILKAAEHCQTVDDLVFILESSEKFGESEEPEARIRAMTIHASKGLDADVVILIDENFSLEKAKKSTKESKLVLKSSKPIMKSLFLESKSFKKIAKNPIKTDFDELLEANARFELAEYIRLIYVGITRPKNSLYMILKDSDCGKKLQYFANCLDK